MVVVVAGCQSPAADRTIPGLTSWTGPYQSQGSWDLSGPLGEDHQIGDIVEELIIEEAITLLGVPSWLEGTATDLVEDLIGGMIAGPINDELGSGQKLHPYRRANICDACTSSFSYMMPWHLWAFVIIATIEPLVKIYPFIKVPAPTSFPFVTFYPAAIFLVILFSIITGFGRIFEGEDGKVIHAGYQNEIPKEAMGMNPRVILSM